MNNDKTKALLPTRFWQEVYIAAIKAGATPDYAQNAAQKALVDLQKLTVGDKG